LVFNDHLVIQLSGNDASQVWIWEGCLSCGLGLLSWIICNVMWTIAEAGSNWVKMSDFIFVVRSLKYIVNVQRFNYCVIILNLNFCINCLSVNICLLFNLESSILFRNLFIWNYPVLALMLMVRRDVSIFLVLKIVTNPFFIVSHNSTSIFVFEAAIHKWLNVSQCLFLSIHVDRYEPGTQLYQK